MANSKDNLSKYGKAFIGFDEPSGNVMDSIGGYTGTVTGATRVGGWNDKGNAMSFNGINQFVEFNGQLIPLGAKSIRFKIKIANNELRQLRVIDASQSVKDGMSILTLNGGIRLVLRTRDNVAEYYFDSNKKIADNSWHDILIIWDGTKNTDSIRFYIDDMSKPDSTFALSYEPSEIYSNLFIGKANPALTDADKFIGQLDSIEIYDRVISPIPDKYLVQHNSQSKYHNGTTWQSTTPTEENFIQYGMNNLDHIEEKYWKELSGDKSVIMWSDFVDKQLTSVVLNKNEFKAQDLLGDKPQVLYYTDSDASQIALETSVNPYSVYDYIGELPTVVAYVESTEDIIVSTTTEPFDIYEELGDSVEVLYYTDDEAVKEADLILEANWSPVDELEGDFEVVTWTDESPETAKRVLEMKAVPKPQFIKLVNPKRLYGYLDDVFINDISKSYRNEARYFIAGEDTSEWYVWDKKSEKFVIVDTSTEQNILDNGMKYSELNDITNTQWHTWKGEYLNIGVFLKDNPRDTIVSVVESVSYEDYLPRNTAAIKNTSLYIINTTAKIDISFNGNILKGVLSDSDLTRVHYRVLLNGGNFYPSDGSFTKLGESPQNIELLIESKDIKIDDWNNLRVEFQDFFGTTDYWQTSFIGAYTGLMFKDVYGEYYSSEIGEVLKYLDFGVIIAGQTTIEHEVILKNQYGYDVKNIHLFTNTSNFPTGMDVEFSENLTPFIPNKELILNNILKNNEEMSFFIRLKTTLGATPDANGSFDIIVRADKA